MRLNSVKVGSVKPFLKGLFFDSIPFEIRNEKGDWSPWFGQFENQRKELFDTNCCWAYGCSEIIEDTLEFLRDTGKMSSDNLKWLQDNGYIDEDNDVYVSRRFIPILSGVKDNGNDEQEAWRLTKKYGAIPNKLLPYTNFAEYFDKDKITDEMKKLGEEFLKRFNVEYEELGKRFTVRTPETIKQALKQGELQIGIPVSWPWNQQFVNYTGSKTPAHSVCLYKYDEVADPEYPYFIYDHYNINLKQLSKDYYIPLITRAVITEKKIERTVEYSVIAQFIKILQDLGIWKLS